MEKTIYEIQYNEEFSVRVISSTDSMGQMEYDKAAFQAVLSDVVLREKEESETVEETDALWTWFCTQLGLALQQTIQAEEGDQDPLDTLIHTAIRLKNMTSMDDTDREDSISPLYLVEHLLSIIHDDEDQIESVMYVARMKDGTISSGWTDLNHTEAIGLLEVGKFQVVKEMWKEWGPG